MAVYHFNLLLMLEVMNNGSMLNSTVGYWKIFDYWSYINNRLSCGHE